MSASRPVARRRRLPAREGGLLGLQSPIRELMPELTDMPRDAHPFPTPCVRRFLRGHLQWLYMFSRGDGVLLGGTHEEGASTLDPIWRPSSASSTDTRAMLAAVAAV